MIGLLYRDEAYALISITAPYEESKHPYRYTKLSETCKQVKIINQNHFLGLKQIDKTTLQNNLQITNYPCENLPGSPQWP